MSYAELHDPVVNAFISGNVLVQLCNYWLCDILKVDFCIHYNSRWLYDSEESCIANFVQQIALGTKHQASVTKQKNFQKIRRRF